MSRMLLPTELRRRLASPLWESDPRPLPYHGSALPTELRGRCNRFRSAFLRLLPHAVCDRSNRRCT